MGSCCWYSCCSSDTLEPVDTGLVVLFLGLQQEKEQVVRIGNYPLPFLQGCGSGSESGSGLDPDSIGSVDPDPDSESGSGSRRAKMTHKRRKNFQSSCFEVFGGLF